MRVNISSMRRDGSRTVTAAHAHAELAERPCRAESGTRLAIARHGEPMTVLAAIEHAKRSTGLEEVVHMPATVRWSRGPPFASLRLSGRRLHEGCALSQTRRESDDESE
jgi:antitoxin (DNA-binding transcriptional repressor) of toxin-antitoxin stability system